MGARYEALSPNIFEDKPILIKMTDSSSIHRSRDDRYSLPVSSSSKSISINSHKKSKKAKRSNSDSSKSEEAMERQNFDIKSVFDDEDESDL